MTPREVEVLVALARGHTYHETGVALGVSVNTVRSFVRDIYRKLDVSSRTEAVLEGVRRGLVVP